MRKKQKILFIALLIILLAMQFYRPQISDSLYRDVEVFEAETVVNAEVKTILEKNVMIVTATRRFIPGMLRWRRYPYG